ncbi:MAG: response regulator [Campylobacterota bacterium]|nr:response regulator [Campylobacterota bacterium]
MIDVKKVRELTKELTILYAEDEISAQKEIEKTLKIFFKKIIVASDGEEGLELFYKHKDEIDLVMSDIMMPKIDGLGMVAEIRSVDRDLPVIMLTAFNDQEYFVKSISLKIDKYLIKPLDQRAFIETINDVARSLTQKKLLEQLLRENQNAELIAKEKETISKITEAYSLPMIIFKDGKTRHFSNTFTSLFGAKIGGDIDNITPDMIGLFDSERGYLNSFDGYDDKNYENNRVLLNINSGRKIFRVYKKDIDVSDGLADMFILIDITFEEHIKAKENSYTQSLEKQIIQEKSSNIKKQENQNISAEKYTVDVDPDAVSKLLELDKLDNDFYESISDFEEGSIENLGKISVILSKYAISIQPFNEFVDIFVAINNLSELLSNLDIGILSINEHSSFVKNLHIIRDELSHWRKDIFIDQTETSIHVHDAPLFSACLQIETLFSNIDDEIIEEVSDFDFF